MDSEFYFAYDERAKWRELAEVRCPVLVVRGADSHLWDDASVDKVLGALMHGCGTKAIIPNAGHWVVRSFTLLPFCERRAAAFFGSALTAPCEDVRVGRRQQTRVSGRRDEILRPPRPDPSHTTRCQLSEGDDAL